MADAPPILVADDEPLLRDMIRRLLERAGFSVLLVADAPEVLRRVEGDAPLTAVLLDMRMFPDAAAALRTIRTRRPDVALVLISGEFPDRRLQETLDACAGSFLKKPFAPEALLEQLGATLDPATRPSNA